LVEVAEGGTAMSNTEKGRMKRALVIGKFWPPHYGHHQMIESITPADGRVFVIVCAPPGQSPSALVRARWLQAVHPHADVIVVDDLCAHHHPRPCAPQCTPLWANRVRELELGPIDFIATNEWYGPKFAEALGAQHLYTDADREAHAVSATNIRSELSEYWRYLHPIVRAGLFRRVVVLGAESTGTTTLAHDLAQAIGAPSTGEAGRTVSWQLYASAGGMDSVDWNVDIFWKIVDDQIRLEHDAIWGSVAQGSPFDHRLGPWLACDTDTLATVAWWERYLGSDSTALFNFARSRLADLYILTSPLGIDFDDGDPTRDGQSIRQDMHDRFRELLESSGSNWIEVNGDRGDRLHQAFTALEDFEQQHPRFVHTTNTIHETNT
jgi:HTH-type transcriptional repressor of NAD biosynthesis genes